MNKINFDWKKVLRVFLMVLAFVLVFSLGYFVSSFNQPLPAENNGELEEIVNSDAQDIDEVDTVPEPVSEFNETIDGTVSWLAEWQVLTYTKEKSTLPLSVKLGDITTGEYAGWSLNMNIIYSMRDEYQYFIQKDNNEILLATSAPLLRELNDYPDSVQYRSYTYKVAGQIVVVDVQDLKKTQIDGQDFYLSEDDCLIFIRPDKLAVGYSISLPFINEENRLLDITFDGKQKNSDSYTYLHLTCGFTCLPLSLTTAEELKPKERLVVAGRTSTGEIFYEFKNSDDPALKALYENKNSVAYFSENGDFENRKNQYTYEQFLSYHPLLYWQEPFGDWVEFKNDRFAIAAEMCKPVIYLYPEQVTELSVKVSPNGGFTFTKPEYGDGWQVTAYPNGILQVTGQEYPYLFWEGIGLNYPKQETGFVIAQQKLDEFLTEKLTLLGLQDKELSDFKDYWLPRLIGLNKPYYKLSFLNQNQIEAIAPLSITPINPETVIRIVMTVSGLDQFEIIPEQLLPPTPVRFGFTVVEWGGAVLE